MAPARRSEAAPPPCRTHRERGPLGHLLSPPDWLEKLRQTRVALADVSKPRITTGFAEEWARPLSLADPSIVSQGALAGAIVGPIVALLLIAATGFIWWRRRKGQPGEKPGDEPFEKPMLHSDSMPKPLPPEKDGETVAQELYGSAPEVYGSFESPAEAVGTEVVAQELPASAKECVDDVKRERTEPRRPV